MPRRRRPDLGRRSQSNVRRDTSRANRTYDQREADNENSSIGMSELRSRVSKNEVDRPRMQRVRAYQRQKQRALHNEIELSRRISAPVTLERAILWDEWTTALCQKTLISEYNSNTTAGNNCSRNLDDNALVDCKMSTDDTKDALPMVKIEQLSPKPDHSSEYCGDEIRLPKFEESIVKIEMKCEFEDESNSEPFQTDAERHAEDHSTAASPGTVVMASKDKFDLFSHHVANELRTLPPRNALMAQEEIQFILMQYKMRSNCS